MLVGKVDHIMPVATICYLIEALELMSDEMSECVTNKILYSWKFSRDLYFKNFVV